MVALIVIGSLALLAASFVAGVAVGRRNKTKVEAIASAVEAVKKAS